MLIENDEKDNTKEKGKNNGDARPCAGGLLCSPWRARVQQNCLFVVRECAVDINCAFS
jgi:hypothetical protein